MFNYRLELQTLDGNCVLEKSFICASFLFMSVCCSSTLKGKKNTHTRTMCLGQRFGLIQGCIMAIEKKWLNINIPYDL